MTDKTLNPPAGDTRSNGDTWFDDRADRFERNIYGSRKGTLRLALLREDMASHIPGLAGPDSLDVLDAGGGLGQMSILLAEAGHQVLLCEPSQAMLEKARQRLETLPCAGRITLACCPLQSLQTRYPDKEFDVIVCHAVLEWLADPLPALAGLLAQLKPGGYLSLAFYNIESVVWKNLVKGNFRKVKRGDLAGEHGSLTPQNPLAPSVLLDWLSRQPVEIISTTGIRCLADYLWPSAQVSDEDLLDMERQLGKRDPYRWLGRYIHVIARRM